MKIRSILVITSILLCFNATTARADNCCRDFFTCAAAVATVGLSCAADLALQEINRFTQEAQQAQSNGQQQYQRSASQLANQLSQTRRQEEQLLGRAASEAAAANDQAQQIAGSLNASGLSAQSRDSLRRAVAATRQIQNTVDGEIRSDFYEDLSTANQVARDGLEIMNGVFVASFMAPMTALIAPLLVSIPDPLITAAAIVGMVATINHIKSEFDREFPPSVAQSQRSVAEAMAAMQIRRTEAASLSSRAQGISSAMQRVANNPNQQNIAQLNSLLDQGSGGNVQLQQIDRRAINSQTRQFNSLPQITNLSQGLPQKIDRSLTQLATTAQQTSRVTSQRLDTRPYQNQVDGYLDKYFKGKTSAQIDQQRKKLISQANSRYKSDPKTRSQVVALIDERAQRYSKVDTKASSQKTLKPQATTTKPR